MSSEYFVLSSEYFVPMEGMVVADAGQYRRVVDAAHRMADDPSPAEVSSLALTMAALVKTGAVVLDAEHHRLSAVRLAWLDQENVKLRNELDRVRAELEEAKRPRPEPPDDRHFQRAQGYKDAMAEVVATLEFYIARMNEADPVLAAATPRAPVAVIGAFMALAERLRKFQNSEQECPF